MKIQHPISLSALVLCSLFSSFVTAEPKVALDPIYENLELDRPLALVIPKDGTKRRFLVEQTGKIKILPTDETADEGVTVFMDLNDRMRVDRAFEEGLLGLAFHPKYQSNGKFYIYYNKQGPKRTLVSEFTVSADDPNQADMSSERILMEIQQPEWNHNSGNLLFHPTDGYLYIAVGDGGRRNGVFLLAQNKTRWNGKVLRIDVDGRSEGLPYRIPADNPFAKDPIACPEIYALGLRNPWGCWVDPDTGLFYLADVGQDLWEEINLIEKGGNYGWEHREGAQDFAARAKLMAAINSNNKKPKDTILIDPIFQYDHTPPTGGMSITGGYVYRGKAIPELVGHFVYGDWRWGNLWSIHHNPVDDTTQNYVLRASENIGQPLVQPTGFYPDENGEPIVLGWKGNLYRMVPKQ